MFQPRRRPSDSPLARRPRQRSASPLQRKRSRRSFVEPLEPRHLLAGLVSVGPNLLSSGAGLIDDLTDLLPPELRDNIPASAERLLDLVDSGTVYQAFPGEVNQVSVEGDLGNFVLLFGERSEVTVGRLGIGTLPPVGTQQELLDMVIPDFEFGIELGGDGGPLVVEVGGDVDADISITGKQIREFIKQFFDLGDSRSIVFNASALLDLIPDLSNLLGVVENVLDFDIRDVLPTIDIDPIVDIDLPFGLPDIEIPPEVSVDIGQFLDDVGIPTSFNDLANLLPGPVGDALNIVVGALDFLKGEFISDSIFVSTLDGPDGIDFSRLTGIPVQVYAGSGSDVITPGGSSNVFDTIFDTLLDLTNPLDVNLLDGLFDNNPARIELFGEGGTDTFLINRRFNALDLHVDGGDGNDEIIVNGTGRADIIEIIAGSNGQLEEIRYFIPDPNGGSPTDEVQQIALPPGTDGGTFRLTFVDSAGLSDTTAAIPFDSDGAAVQSALASLSSVGAGNVAVAGPAAGPWIVTFTNALGTANQRLLVPDGSGLMQSGGEATIQETAQGDATRGNNQIQRIDLPPNAGSSNPTESNYLTAGTFQITFDVQVTEPINHNANGARVQEALEALSNLEPGQVSVTGGISGPYDVEFIGDLALSNQPMLTVNGSSLIGGVRAAVRTMEQGAPVEQTITLPTGLGSLGGTFTLDINGNATAPLAANASSADVEAALATLPGVGMQKVSVTGALGGPYAVTLEGVGVPTGGISGDASQLTGGVIRVTTSFPATAVNEVQAYSVNATSGMYVVRVDNGTIERASAPLPFDATVAEVQAALEQLGSVGGPQNLIVTGSIGSYQLEFTGDLSGVNLPILSLDMGSLNAGAILTLSTVTDGVAGTNERQTISFSPTPTGGELNLQFNGETTAPLPFDAPAAQVQQALEQLASMEPGQIRVTDAGPSSWTVEFVGRLSARNVATITGSGQNLTGGFAAGAIDVSPIPPLIPSFATNEVQQFQFDNQPAGGEFFVVFEGVASPEIIFNAAAADVQNALEMIPAIGAGNVVVNALGSSPETYEITFQNELAATDVDQLRVFTVGQGQSAAGQVIAGLTRNEPVLVEVTQRASLQNSTQLVALPQEASGGTFTLTFKTILVSETNAASLSDNEEQTISLPAGTSGGDFTLSFAGAETAAIPVTADGATLQTALAGLSSIAGAGNVTVTGPVGGPWVVEFTGSLANTDVESITGDAAGLNGNFTTTPLPFNASTNQLSASLQALPLLNSATFDNVRVSAAEIQVAETIRGRLGVNEAQSIVLPSNASAGDFVLTFDGQSTVAIDFDASATDIETALENLPNIDDVSVMGDAGGPWTVVFTGPTVEQTDLPRIAGDASNLGLSAGPWTIEFIDEFSGQPVDLLTVDAANLITQGNGELTVATTTAGGSGTPQLVATKHFNSFVDVEHLRIDTGAGDDHVILRGIPDFPLGIFYAADEGNDTLELISDATAPSFEAPVFPNDDGATVFVDGRAIQFDSMEGGLTFNAAGQAGAVSLSGNDAGNELRFEGSGSGTATFAMDSQVTITLTNFAANSTINLSGAQGTDEIAVALQGVTEFSSIAINGGGPAGSDAVRFEGTPGLDTFEFTPGLDVESGSVLIGTTQLTYEQTTGASFVGLGGADSLVVHEPQAGSNDTIFFNPRFGNDGSFQYATQSGLAGSTLVYPTVEFSSIETRTFNTGTGVDALNISSDDLPGVNSTATVDGGNGTLVAAFGDQTTNFIHDGTAEDIFSFEIGTAVDQVTVTPGADVDIFVNTALGADTLIYEAVNGLIEVDLADGTIAQATVGDVAFTSVEVLRIEGNDTGNSTTNSLRLDGTTIDDRFLYTPLAELEGLVEQDRAASEMRFSGIGGELTISGDSLVGDTVVVLGSNNQDRLILDGPNRTARVLNALGVALKPVVLGGSVELAVLQGEAGSDQFAVSPADDLMIQVDGGDPTESGDRLVVIDEDAGDLVRHHEGETLVSGSVLVGTHAAVAYDHIERIDILPLDPISGGTGVDGGGRVVVFHFDQHEQNDSFLNPTEFLDLQEAMFRPNIDPAGVVDPFGLGFDEPGDEDWYRFTAPKIGSFRFEVSFESIANLPGSGDLDIELYDEDQSLIAAGAPLTLGNLAGEQIEFEVDEDQEVYLRIRGASPDAINVYDIDLVEIDLVGPRVTGVNISDDPNTPEDESSFDLFTGKTDPNSPAGGRLEPTPLVQSLTIHLEDLIIRPPGAQGFVYPALDPAIAANPGHYSVRGDHSGVIPIQEVIVTNATPVVGTIPTATIELVFFEPLPDDRLTLSISDSLLDPPGNRADGESNTLEPQDPPQFPSGDEQAGGLFEARFTVDSRPELGLWSAGSVFVDTNGNLRLDPENADFTNEDITYTLGFASDSVFAGNFSETGTADGFDKLAAYGLVAGQFRWLIDTDNDGVPNLVVADPNGTNALPFAGNFDGDADNGDEVGLYDGTQWFLDTDHDFNVDTILPVSGNSDVVGYPIAGDFDGDGIDDLGAWTDDTFTLDLSGGNSPDGLADTAFRFGFIGVRERPVAADFDGDGIDDVGLWVPDRTGSTPESLAEWYLLISGGGPITDRLRLNPEPGMTGLIADFRPEPFGNDVYATLGDEFAVPVVGNFDPPVTPLAPDELQILSYTNPVDEADVNNDSVVSPVDVLFVINELNARGSSKLPVVYAEVQFSGPFFDTSQDRVLSPSDALLVINRLNDVANAEGESESGAEAVATLASAATLVPQHFPHRGLTNETLARSQQPEATVSATDEGASPGRNDIENAEMETRVKPSDSAGRRDSRSPNDAPLEELLDLLAEEIDARWNS